MPVGKMYSTGEKSSMTCEAPSSPHVYYPSISLDTKQAPFLKGVLPNSTIKLVVECKIKRIEIGDKETEYRLNIQKVGVIGKPPKDELTNILSGS